MKSKTFSIITLGCKVNQYESEFIKKELIESGFTESIGDTADVFIVNTCSVTHIADRKSRQKVRQCLALSKSPVIVTGCAAKNKFSGLLSMEGVTFIEKKDIVSYVTGLFASSDLSGSKGKYVRDRDRVYLKIGDGCNNFCTYCIVPYVRGRITNRASEDILKEVDTLTDAAEIILVAIHLGAYKIGDYGLSSLVGDILKKKPDIRLRLSSIEPIDFSEDLIKAVCDNKAVARHIHLPLQHASNKILAAMHRGYTREDFKGIIDSIRAKIPDISITTDIIVGFPGESEEDFDILKSFVKEINFYDCHIFKYSKRTGTPAADMPEQVPEDVKNKRSEELINIAADLTKKHNLAHIGKVVEIIPENIIRDNVWTGLSSEYIRVNFSSGANIKGKMCKVAIKEVKEDGSVWGELLL